jgi:hypothetical protein
MERSIPKAAAEPIKVFKKTFGKCPKITPGTGFAAFPTSRKNGCGCFLGPIFESLSAEN